MKSLLSQSSTSNGAAAVAYIGKDAVLNSDTTHLSDDKASWSYDVTGSSGPVTLSVRDSAGKEVYKTTAAASSGGQTFDWNGKDASGRALAEGNYRLVVTANDTAGKAITPAINVNEKITAIDFSGATPNLVTTSGARAFDTILRIRN